MKRQYRDKGSGSRPATNNTTEYVWSRDKGTCVYCGKPAQVLDHVIPWADNGPSISSNLVCSCYRCNTYKGKHPKGLDQLVKAIFWLSTHGEDTGWMAEFYPKIKTKVRKPIEPAIVIKLEPFVSKEPKRSSRTKSIALRLSNEVYGVLERRVAKSSKWMKVSEYIKDRITSDALRKR